MEAFKLDFTHDACSRAPLPLLAGTRTYRNRSVEYSDRMLESRISRLQDMVAQSAGNGRIYSAIQKSLLREAEDTAQFISYETNRYYEVLPNVWIDRFNTLEYCGCMHASKRETILYSFYDKFAYLLAFLFQEDPEIVERRLRENCDKYDVDYDILSYAFCTFDIQMIESINLQVLADICEMLDLFIQDIFWYSNTCVYTIGDTILNIADVAFTPEERVTTYLITSIAYIQQNLLSQIIEFFQQQLSPFITSRYCMLCSKGFGNVVITAADVSVFPPISVSLGDRIQFEIEPITYKDLGGAHEGCWNN